MSPEQLQEVLSVYQRINRILSDPEQIDPGLRFESHRVFSLYPSGLLGRRLENKIEARAVKLQAKFKAYYIAQLEEQRDKCEEIMKAHNIELPE